MYCLLRLSVTLCIFFSLIPGIAGADSIPSTKTVKSVQTKLNNYGYNNGPADGKIGQKTVTALKLFQEDYELPVSGQIDVVTLAELGIDGKFKEVAAVPAKKVTAPQKEPKQTGQSSSALTQSGNFVQDLGGTLTQIGDDNSDSWVGSGFSMAGKIYTSMGKNISAFGENEKSAGEASNDLLHDASSAVLEPDK